MGVPMVGIQIVILLIPSIVKTKIQKTILLTHDIIEVGEVAM
jgi:hypothetical protein